MLVASGKKTGIGHYASQLLNGLGQQVSAGDAIDVFPRPWLRWGWSVCNRMRPHLERRKSRNPHSPNPAHRAALMGWLRGLGQNTITAHLGHVHSRHHYDLYHEPNYIPLASDLPTVATVHDLSILLHPEWHPADRVKHFEKNFQKALAQCVHFLAISETGRQEISRTFHIPAEKITRTYMGVRPGLSVLPDWQVAATLHRLGLPRRYLLYLGTIEPRKNLLMLLQVYCSLPLQLRERWPLVLVGGWGWNTGAVRDYLESEARHRGVIHLGYVAEDHLNLLYNGARALVYPSFYEGFGLPPIEMMACGGAVLASTAGALVETVGARAHLTDPHDADGWRQALTRVVEDDDWWRSLRAGVTEVARPFTWEQCAADTLKVYRRIAGGQRSGEMPRAA
jgi:alpha-1,3-rhamnosyl/mannosyltransferase